MEIKCNRATEAHNELYEEFQQPNPGAHMPDKAALAEIERRIQIAEDNLRELMEQAAAFSGAADEERNANRIAEQQVKLDNLLKQREVLLG
jgi:hypothetical protein